MVDTGLGGLKLAMGNEGAGVAVVEIRLEGSKFNS